MAPLATADAPLSKEASDRLRAALEGAWSASTRRAYRWGWARFEAWAQEAGRRALPASPETVAAFLTDVAERPKASAPALRTALAAIAWAHDLAEVVSPTRAPAVKLAWQSVRAKLGLAAAHKRDPLTLDVLQPLLAAVDRQTPRGKRDAAVILLAFHAARRRAEIAALRASDIRPVPNGIGVYIRRSKTDQEGEGAVVGVKTWPAKPELCAVKALRDWLATSKRTGETSLFGIAGKTVDRIIQRCAEKAGLKGNFGGHSPRAGFVTEAYRRKASDAEIMGTTLHKNTTSLAGYRREADPIAAGASRYITGFDSDEKD